MSHIVEFKITGLAGRKNTIKEKLHRNLNVFFGLNGTGKSSLLKILHSAMEGDARQLSLVPFESAEVVIHSLALKKNFTRKIHRKDLKNTLQEQKKLSEKQKMEQSHVDNDVRYTFSQYLEDQKWGWSTSIPDLPTAYQHIYLPTHRILAGTEQYIDYSRMKTFPDIGNEFDWDRYFASNLENLWMKYSNTSLSQIRIIQQQGLANILKGILSLDLTQKTQKNKITSQNDMIYNRVAAFLERQDLPQIIKDKEHFQQRYQSNSVFRQIVTDIDEIERKIETAGTTRNKLQSLISELFSGNKSVIFSDTGIEVKLNDGNKIGLHSLSSGEKQAILVFIETLLIGESALMIDEPEISLHINWQKNLISSMQMLNPNAQLIFATHSPEIMADVPDENIFKL